MEILPLFKYRLPNDEKCASIWTTYEIIWLFPVSDSKLKKFPDPQQNSLTFPWLWERLEFPWLFPDRGNPDHVYPYISSWHFLPIWRFRSLVYCVTLNKGTFWNRDFVGLPFILRAEPNSCGCAMRNALALSTPQKRRDISLLENVKIFALFFQISMGSHGVLGIFKSPSQRRRIAPECDKNFKWETKGWSKLDPINGSLISASTASQGASNRIVLFPSMAINYTTWLWKKIVL